MKKNLLVTVMVLAPLSAGATPLTIPYTAFATGTPISKTEMNSNFTTIQSYINGSVCLANGTNCLTNGTVTNIATGTGLTGGPITASGTIAVDVGTAAGKIVQLNGSAQLPAVDGSQLTSLNASNFGSGTLSVTRGGTGATTAATARAALGVPWDYNASDIYYSAGNVGVGTTSPSYPLHISVNDATGLYLQSSNIVGGSGVPIQFSASTNQIAKITPFSGTVGTGGALRFETSSDGISFTPKMTILNSGKVGFGTTTPGRMITVAVPGTSGAGSEAFSQYINGNTGTTANDGLFVG